MAQHLLLLSDEAARIIDDAVRNAVRGYLREAGDPFERALDALTSRPAVLTLARTADLLGVAERTVTETYVKGLGLPAHRTGRTSSPVFVLDEVAEWVRSLGPGGPAERAPMTVVPKGDRRAAA